MKILLPLLAVLAWPAFAHEGHDHGEAAVPPALTFSGDMPRRLSDGTVFLPKPVQRAWGLRTALAEAGEFPAALSLDGRVIADPALGGALQALRTSRVEAPAGGLPRLGQKVRRGEVIARLAYVEDPVEKARQQVMIHEAENALDLARRRERRHQDAPGFFPRREVEETRVEIASLERRIADLRASIAGRESLVSPMDGVVAAVHVQAGQVVEARQSLFEIVDPKRLMVEARAYDPRQATGLGVASGLVGDGQSLRLRFVGGGLALREQALPLLFRVEAPVPPLALGQTVAVVAETRERVRGVAVPVAALGRGGDGGARVWLHAEAERFVPRRVVTRPLDAARVLVIEGLEGGERVVTSGVPWLAQVR